MSTAAADGGVRNQIVLARHNLARRDLDSCIQSTSQRLHSHGGNYQSVRLREADQESRSHCGNSEGMQRGLLFIATVSLTAGLSIVCGAQERDTSRMSREEWQAHVKASRERLDQMRREGKGLVAPPPGQDEIAEAASREVLNDTLVPGDIVSTTRGLFRFRGSPDRERRPEDFERLR